MSKYLGNRRILSVSILTLSFLMLMGSLVVLQETSTKPELAKKVLAEIVLPNLPDESETEDVANSTKQSKTNVEEPEDTVLVITEEQYDYPIVEENMAGVYGIVRDAQTLNPIEGADIEIEEYPDLKTVTDHQGEFAINNIPLNEEDSSIFSVLVNADGYGDWKLEKTFSRSSDARKIYPELSMEDIVLEGLAVNSNMIKIASDDPVIVGPPCDFVSSIADVNANRAHADGQDVDLGANNRAPVLADGTILSTQKCTDDKLLASVSGPVQSLIDTNGGKYVLIDIGGGLRVMELHNESYTSTINDGQVTAGEHIGTIGETGSATFPHIHFEVQENAQALEYSEWEFGDISTPPTPAHDYPVDKYGVLHGERWNLMPPVDVTGDGKADLVAFDTRDGKVDVTRSYGNKFGDDPGMVEGWEVWREDDNYATDNWRLLPLADVTGDGRADLIFYNKSTREVHVSAASTNPSTGDGEFATIQNWNQDTGFSETFWNVLPPADVDGDPEKKADLIMFNKNNTQVKVLLSTGSSFGTQTGGGSIEWNSNTGYDSTNWELLNPTDMTGDGLADLVAYRANNGKIDITPSTGSNFGGGSLGFEVWRTDPNYFTSTWKIQQPADMNGDGKADVAFYNNSTTELHVIPSEGLTGPKAYNWNTNTGYDSTNWRLLPPADVDGKNGADLIAYDTRYAKVDVTRSTGNTFGIAKYGYEKWNSNSGYGTVWEKLDPADVTGDGKADIITFQKNDGRIDVSRAIGNSYSTAEVWRTANSAYAGANWIRLAPADINNDNKADIIFFNTATTEVHIRPSTGSSFGTAVNWNTNTGLNLSTWGILDPSDIDNNGAADLIARNKNTGEIKVCYSNYSSFVTCQTIANTNWNSSYWTMIAPGDINGDGFADLLAYNTSSQLVELRLNDQNGGLNNPISFQTLPDFGVTSIVLDPVDINGDQKDDLILFDTYSTGTTALVSNGAGFGINPLLGDNWNYATGYDTSNWMVLAPADSTGDGKADLIAIHTNPAKPIYTQIDLTRSTGSTFGPGQTDFEVWNYNTGYN